VLGDGTLNVGGTFTTTGLVVNADLNIPRGGTVNIQGNAINTGAITLNGGTLNIGSSGDATHFGQLQACTAGSTIVINVPSIASLKEGNTYTGFNYAGASNPSGFACTVIVEDPTGAKITLTSAASGAGRRLLSADTGKGSFGSNSMTFTLSGTNAASALAPSLVLVIAVVFAALVGVRA